MITIFVVELSSLHGVANLAAFHHGLCFILALASSGMSCTGLVLAISSATLSLQQIVGCQSWMKYAIAKG